MVNHAISQIHSTSLWETKLCKISKEVISLKKNTDLFSSFYK